MTRSSASISVIMATYNGMPFVEAQIRSILEELHPDDELIIVDDGSSDGTIRLIETLEDDRIHLHRHDWNRGVLATFSEALGLATREFIFLSDQDDLWVPGKRQAFLDAFWSDETALLVISDAKVIDESGGIIHESFMDWRGGFKPGLWGNLVRNRFLGCCIAIRKSLIPLALPIPRRVPMHDMWLGCLAAGRKGVRYIPRPLLLYRRHGKNVTAMHPSRIQQMIAWRLNLVSALISRFLGLKWPG